MGVDVYIGIGNFDQSAWLVVSSRSTIKEVAGILRKESQRIYFNMHVPRALKKYSTTMTKYHISLSGERWHSRSVQSQFLWFVQALSIWIAIWQARILLKFFITWILQSEFHSRRASFGQIIVEHIGSCAVYINNSLFLKAQALEYMDLCPVKQALTFLNPKREASPWTLDFPFHFCFKAQYRASNTNEFDVNVLRCKPCELNEEQAQDWISAVMNRRREGHEDVPERPERHEENQIRVLNALKEYDQAPPTSLVLEHVGFGPSNILVDPGDPTKIVGILGWAGARVVPFWGLDFLELDEREWAGCGLSFRNVVMRRFSDGIWYDEDLLTAAWYARKWHVLTDMSGALPFHRS
ncbi:hypothetical protein IW262DRAFT_1299103 [Armillaria fumosa]|nr:hypothetical protein IW262DRAFT_1299103 [Armillaria fumosa]